MLMFVAEIAFLLELALIAWGLIIFGKAETKDNKYQKLAGWILIIGSTLTMLCTLYFSMRYMGQGGFELAMRSNMVLA
ncbi:MAG: hypothetical protein COB36_13440 [Alphaproteobacteria bacterium]|nr:MAG: hypothetical protein COB36_13440 [Alphaproteobacteria bacterium]